ELNDAKAMNDALKLSRFPQVVISARISHSGQAIGQPGDLQGASGVIEVASQKEPVVVTIQQEVQ
ncbi:MAG TPA: c-type cytochrome biogenesis protein CcmI, partial [Pseudomonadales bacterium]|nr:c-type cytochrome biogenesis protein CcmI [Pseudomonadales bacterium]